MSELLNVRLLVLESLKQEYMGFLWSGGREGNPKMYQFASAANIEPSTMQTKVRAMIRYGFIKDGNRCPFVWTRMGSLWNDLHAVGNYDAARKVYELALAISLAMYAFDGSSGQFSMNPSKGELPLRFLLNILDQDGSISLREFEVLVDGATTRVGGNASYWKTDLMNSGLFGEERGRLYYTGQYYELVQDIRSFNPDPLLTDHDWREIRDNPLIDISPFKHSIQKTFEALAEGQTPQDPVVDAVLTEPIVDMVAEETEKDVADLDVLSTDTRFSHSIRRVRNATWAIRIKRKYRSLCAIPNCDVTGLIFVQAAHIKPDNAPDSGTPHRHHILNGLCLCRHCHVAFERGYFSLTDDCKVVTSSVFHAIPDQSIKRVILSSADTTIRSRTDNRFPLPEFIQYHRTNLFKA